MKELRSIYIFAGEPSGDNHGAALARSIKKKHPNWLLRGVCGPSMRKEEVVGSMEMEQFSVMGITDVLLNLPKLVRLFKQVRDEILNLQPDVVVFIDYPVFNIRMAKALRKKGYKGKLVHYICPSVWAHGKNRIQKMAQSLDLLMTIFPFEPPYFAGTNLTATYVGNPVAESVQNYKYDLNWTHKVGLEPEAEIVSLFPGSRKGAVSRNLPIQLSAAEQFFKSNPNVRFAISCSSPELLDLMNHHIQKKKKLPITIVPSQYRYELMRDSTTALATSGTVTLELALHKTPTVVNYVLTRLNNFVAKCIYRLNLPHYCIVNILGKKEIFPEHITTRSSPDIIAKKLNSFHQKTKERQQCLDGCKEVTAYLTNTSASDNAVKCLETLLQC